MSKVTRPKDTQRFTADEIVRAIEAVTKVGLTVHAVEITQSGSIKIETQPQKQPPSRAANAPNTADVQETSKKQA
jgi:hypothetical protein